MLINNGVINVGDNNNNIVNTNVDYEGLLKELNILYNHAKDKEEVREAIIYLKQKNDKKLIECFRKFSKFTMNLIKELSLKIIESYIQKYINL